jgi:hypothetical protein
MQRVESRLRGELQQEHAAVHAAMAADEAPAVDEQPVPEPAPPLRQRRSPRPSSTPLLSDYQSRAIEALLLLKNATPDEPPTPRAGTLTSKAPRDVQTAVSIEPSLLD